MTGGSGDRLHELTELATGKDGIEQVARTRDIPYPRVIIDELRHICKTSTV